jgi:hypothetical protein
MKLRIFRSDKGDSLLLESSDEKLVLVDGGMSSSMKKHVAPHLAELRDAGRELEAVYVSHIDQDHISGVLAMLDAELDWRVFHANQARGDPSREPSFPRPPVMKTIWHNAFHDQVPKNAGAIASQIAASAPVFLATQNDTLTEAGMALSGIATSIDEALQVSRLIKEDLLDIPLNAIPGNKKAPKLLRAGQFKPFAIGAMTFTIVGPTDDELEKLREGWNNWLRDNPDRVKAIRQKMDESADKIAAWEGVRDFKGVTIPNIASLTFMVEEDGKRLLLTGDTQHEILMGGLRQTGFLKDGGTLHVDVLKVQHHGAAANMSKEFAESVTANHYVFCGDGAHENPEAEVLETIFDARMRADDTPFVFWFSSSPTKNPASKREKNFAHMAETVAKLKKKSGGRLKVEYNTDDFLDLEP